eukprot:7256552-Pyramimonas_sp.AAC.1
MGLRFSSCTISISFISSSGNVILNAPTHSVTCARERELRPSGACESAHRSEGRTVRGAHEKHTGRSRETREATTDPTTRAGDAVGREMIVAWRATDCLIGCGPSAICGDARVTAGRDGISIDAL